MISRRDLRFDGKLFFLYDREAVTSEEDPPENAIIYFYPTSSTIESRISICGQLVGMSNFLTTVMDFAPVLINLKTEKVALCQSGQYTLALGGTMSEPETLLLKQLETLFNIFVFYHGSLDTVRKLSKDHATFLTNMSIIWDCYLHFVRHYGDTLPAVFNPLPFLKTPKNSSGCFLKASHILQACQRRHHILGGCILHQKSVLCTQLETSITKRLLLLKPNQSHHPGKQVKIDIKLPFGVRFMESFVTYSEYNQLIKALQKSPYHASIKGVKLRPCKSPKPQHFKEETTVNKSAKEGSSLQVQSAERQRPNVLTRENSHTQPTQKPTTKKAVKENMDLETSTNRVTKEHSGDPKLDVEDSTSVEPDKGNSQSSSSKTVKQKKEIKKPSTIKENGKTRKKSGNSPRKPSLKKKSNENEIFDGKIIDEIKKDEVRVNDELNAENIDDCDRGNLKQNKKEVDDDNAKEPQCGSELIMDEIDISGLRIVNDNMKGPVRDIIEQGINGQSFIDSSRETDCHDHIDNSCNDSSKVSNDNGVIDDTLDPSRTTICNGAKGHSSTDPSRAKSGTSVSSSNVEGFSKDVKDKLSNGPRSADVHPGGDVENLHIDQAINECPRNSNDFLGREMNVSSSQDSRSKESILDKLKCYSSNFTPQEDVIEEKLQSSMDDDVEGDDNDFHCDSAVRDPRPEFSHPVTSNQPSSPAVDLPSPPIDLPGLHNHSDQASGIHNSQQEMLCSPTEEFHDTVEELDGGIKLTPNTVGAFLHTYQDLKSNDLMAGKYSTLNLNHPEDKKVDKSFFKDLINSDKLANYTTHGFNEHVSDNTASRSTSSLLHREPSRSESTGRESGLSHTSSSSQGEESNRSESTGPESHLTHRTSSLYGSESDRNESTGGESGLSRSATPDSSAPSKLHDSGLCLLHGSSEGSLSQTDGTSNVDSPDIKQSPVDFLSEKSSNSTTDLEMSCSTVCGDGEEVQKEQAEYVDDFDENLYQIDGLVHVNLYVQAHSNTVLILLADSSLSQDPETIKALWKTTLNEIGELEVQLNQFYKANSDYFDKLEDFNFVVYDSISSTTKGNLSEPVEQVDFKFCDTAKTVHEQFNNCTSLKSVTLRDHSSAVHCQRSLDQEVYFHKKGSLKPFRGSPSPRDSAFTLERRAPKRLKKDYGVNII